MAENEKVQSSETQTNEERATPQKPNGVMIKRARIHFKISC